MNIFSNHYIPLFSFININKERRNKYSLIVIIITIKILTVLFALFTFFKFTKKTHNIYLEQKFDTRNVAFNKSINFIKSCISNDLYKFQSSYNFQPKVSVIIPMYNCEKYILRAVRSVQLQNLSEIEILLIDDNSSDNTLSIVTNMRNKDGRIRLVKNKNNMGILYSRSIGVLSSRGKYIFTLDNDDIFLDYDVFDTMTKIGDEGKFDIVEFKAISNIHLNEDIFPY